MGAVVEDGTDPVLVMELVRLSLPVFCSRATDHEVIDTAAACGGAARTANCKS